MREHVDWSLSLGRWKGVHVRVHVFFLLFGAVTLLIAWQQERGGIAGNLTGLAGLSLLILLAGVVVHVLGHCFAVSRQGGYVERLTIVPWGDLGSIRLPLDPRAEFVALLAGPLANLLVCLVLTPAILVASDGAFPALMHPLAPSTLTSGAVWVVALKLGFWINWLLALVNLLPAFPFDGGKACVAALATMWPAWTRRQAVSTVARVARFAALALVVLTFFAWSYNDTWLVPSWFAMLLLSIFLFFSANQEEARQEDEESDDLLFGYDFSQGFTSLEQSVDPPQPTSGPIGKWLDNRREQRRLRQQESEAEEDRRVDEILQRLHANGIDALSPEDRALLKRVSARYRSRNASS